MELSAARVTLLVLLLGFLCGGGVVAVRDCESTTTTFPVRGAANQLAAAAAAAEDDCTTHSAHVSTGGGTAAAGPTCDASLMASQLTQLCRIETDAPGALCCATVLLTVEQDTNCLCRVADAAEFDVSDLSVAQVWEWYKSCGGRRSVPRDEDSCEPGSPPPAAKPEAPSASPLRLWLAVGLLCAAAVATAVFAGLRLWLPRTVAPVMQGKDQGGKLNLGQHQDVNDAAMTGLPQVTSGPGDVRPRAGEDAATAIAIGGSGEEEEEEEEEVSPPVSPMRVEGRSQLARARLPSPPPFEPPPPPVVPPEAVMPVAPPVIMAF